MASGDIYQVNLTTPMSTRLKTGVSAQALYLSMRARNPAPFGAMLRLSEEENLLCLSPERLLKWSPGGEVRTEPIKGTRPRGDSEEQDRSSQRALLESLKDRAEHTMIVDLERNDLGRLCLPGSVRVEALRSLQSYPTVHHMVSHVVGQLQPKIGIASLLKATFPGGSITGAPKLRATQVISRLEASPRGLYCGALGYLSPCGGGDLNLPIRTAWLSGDLLTYHAGGGVVADSTPEGEWEELWVKSAALSHALGH
jgi:anthranilate/para-aminobenzoate synthase component I